MRIFINNNDPTPPYEQLRRQIAATIRSGELAPDTRLPTVRQLAGDLGVANGTVMRAYSELETEGLVATARGAGTRVAADRSTVTRAADKPVRAQSQLENLAHAFIKEALTAGASREQILESVRSALS